MNILFLTSNLGTIGGIQRYNKNFISSLKEEKENVIIVELKDAALFSKIHFSLKFFYKVLFSRPDIIICAHISFSFLCYIAKFFSGIPYTVTVYGIEVINIKKKKFIRALKSARFIIKLFDRTAENLIKQIPEVKDKILSLPNSIDGKKFFIKDKSSKLIDKFGLKDSLVIYTICRLSKSKRDDKGYEKVIRAMPRVIRYVPNAKYLLAGDGNDKPYVEKVIEELKLKKSVILTGSIKNEEVVDFYNFADVFVFPSKREGFPPIVLLEALACGKVVIGGNQAGAEKMLSRGNLGIVVTSDSVEEIADAIIKVLTKNIPNYLLDPELLRKRVLDKYGAQKHREHVRSLLNNFKNKKQ